MNKLKLTPYIDRDGDAREMLEFYHKLLGGKLRLSTFGEAPIKTPESDHGRISHGRLDVEGYLTIMADDVMRDTPPPPKDSNINLALVGLDEDKLRKIFDGLSAGGKVTMALEKQFWGDIFGMVTDKFGVHWLINIGDTEPHEPKNG